MTAVDVSQGERRTLQALAFNVASGKTPWAQAQANDLVPLLCDVPNALTLFGLLVHAVRCQDGPEEARLLDLLTAGA